MTVKLSGPLLPPVSGKATSLVVLLHGYGSDGRDLIALGQFWRDSFPDTMFVAPNAPHVCAGNPQGFQWFALELDGDRDLARVQGAQAARPAIEAFLADLWAQTGLTAADTVLAGFSQGAMMALDTGLRLSEPLKGIIAFSGLVVAPDTLDAELASTPPVLLVHGDVDDIVPIRGSEAALPLLEGLGVDVRLHVSKGTGHAIAEDGLLAATDFLKSHLGSGV